MNAISEAQRALLGGWRTDLPPAGTVVEVWLINTVTLAVWDGAGWKTTAGAPLAYITHWRPKK